MTQYGVRVLPPTDLSTSLPIAFLWGPPYATPADMSVPVHPSDVLYRAVLYCTVLRVILTALFPCTGFSILMRPFANSTCRRLQLSHFSNTSRCLRVQASLTEDGLISANRPVSVACRLTISFLSIPPIDRPFIIRTKRHPTRDAHTFLAFWHEANPSNECLSVDTRRLITLLSHGSPLDFFQRQRGACHARVPTSDASSLLSPSHPVAFRLCN